MTEDHYCVLGVPRAASMADIKRAYHQLALQYHPDKNPDGASVFKKISTAYQVLSDKTMRYRYDQTLGTQASVNAGEGVHRPPSRTGAAGNAAATNSPRARDGPTTSWRPASAGSYSYASRTDRKADETGGMSQEELDQLRDIRTRHEAARKAHAQQTSAMFNSSFEAPKPSEAPKPTVDHSSPNPPPRQTASSGNESNHSALGEMLDALRRQKEARAAAAANQQSTPVRPSSAGAQRATPPPMSSPLAPHQSSPYVNPLPSSSGGMPPRPMSASTRPTNNSSPPPPTVPLPESAEPIIPSFHERNLSESMPPLSNRASFVTEQAPSPSSPPAESPRAVFARKYNPELRGRPAPPEPKPSTSTRVKFDEPVTDKQPSAPASTAPAQRRPSLELKTNSSPPPPSFGSKGSEHSESSSSDVDLPVAPPPPKTEVPVTTMPPTRRKWDEERRAALASAKGSNVTPAQTMAASAPMPVMRADSPSDELPVRTPRRVPLRNSVSPAALNSSTAGENTSSTGSKGLNISISDTDEKPSPSVHAAATNSPKRVPLVPRSRPGSASASGPTPDHSGPTSIPSDNEIARLTAEEARALVVQLEHKLRIARQTVLIRALDKSAAS